MKVKELEGEEDSKANMQRAWGKKYVLSFRRCTNSRLLAVFSAYLVLPGAGGAVD